MMSPQEFARLVDSQAAALVLYARQWCAVPEDVVQEAFLKLVAQRPPPDNPAAWLYRVVRNAARSAARSARRRQRYEAAAAARAPAWFDDANADGLDAATATEALQDLPPDEREVIVAHLWGGLTFEQIAQAVGSSAATCYRRYAAGLDVLRSQLGAVCPTSPTT